jgi:hypothetical protein
MNVVEWKTLSPIKRIFIFYGILIVLTLLLATFFWITRDSPQYVRDSTLVIGGAVIGNLIYDVFKVTFDI